jgi:hypothetical protein
MKTEKISVKYCAGKTGEGRACSMSTEKGWEIDSNGK